MNKMWTDRYREEKSKSNRYLKQMTQMWNSGSKNRYQRWEEQKAEVKRTPTVGPEPTTIRLRALRSADWARRAYVTATSDTLSSGVERQLLTRFAFTERERNHEASIKWSHWTVILLKSMLGRSQSSIRFVRPTLKSNTSDPARFCTINGNIWTPCTLYF